jgi:hypothetical protein
MPSIHINETGINKLLANLNPHKACGPDNINGRVLKELKDQIAPTNVYHLKQEKHQKIGNTQTLLRHLKKENNINL